jgi:hypothetical protein
MKQSISCIGIRLILLTVFFKSLTALGQMPDGGVNSAMIKLFGENAAFTAQAEVRVLNSNRVVWLQMPGVFAAADTKLRVDVDMNLIRSASITPAMIKQLGLDRITSVIRPDKKTTYLIYPGKKSFVSMPLSPEDAQVAAQKLEKKPLAKETIDGHACVKNLSTVKSSKGTVLVQATTWNAPDLKDFPIQIEIKEGGNTSVMHFQNVNLSKPAPALFEVPAGFRDDTHTQDKKAVIGKKK